MRLRTIGLISTLALGLLAAPLPTEAQQAGKVPRIGFVWRSQAPRVFWEALRDVGYIEGKNIVVEYRGLEGKRNRIPSLVAELVQIKVDVLVVVGLPAVRAAKQATKTIPIVMLMGANPVATGLVDSLARPGGNITGFSIMFRELSGKRLELLKEVVPKISRVGVLWDAAGPGAAIAFKKYEATARALKIPLQSLEARGPNPDFEGAFQAAAKARADGLIVIRSILFSRYLNRIADLGIKHRLPSIYAGRAYVEAGGLMTYGPNLADPWRHAAVYVDKILKGAKPADLPVEQPTKFEFVINLKTAKQIGVTIPSEVLLQATKVIK